jgi:CTP:molybdopterin cytidylyltransferase MocA
VIEYRTLAESDIDAVSAFAASGLQPNRYPLVFSAHKVRCAVEHFMHSATDYHRIAVNDGIVVGVIAAAVAEMAYFQRAEAHIFALYATQPGVGRALLRGLLDWMDEHFMVQRVCWMHNPGMPASVHRLARMCASGRVDEMTTTVFYKG